jgi:hypothetical protein
MAISYDGLKRITGAGIVDGTLQTGKFADSTIATADIGNQAVTGGKIANSTLQASDLAANSVTSAKLANNAVNLGTSTVTGTLAVGRGGTGRSSVSGNAYKSLVSRSGAISFDNAGLYRCRVWTSNGTWNRATGVNRIRVQVVGGGGGGSGHGEAGGSGGYSEEYINVNSISSVSITIGGGGGGVNYHNSGGNGGTTSFGPYLSAGGGEGARRVGGHTGGRPGAGSGGNLNIYGGGGTGHTHHGGGLGGESFFGGPCIGVHDSSPQVSNQETRAAPGCGGTGGPRARRRGGTGRSGMVIVWEYK